MLSKRPRSGRLAVRRARARLLPDGQTLSSLLETPEANLSKALRQRKGVYTPAVNRRHGRVGHVLQGRFKVILLERESYLPELRISGLFR